MTSLPDTSVLIRTWFGDEAAWADLVASIQTPTQDGFLAECQPIDDQSFEVLTPQHLAELNAGNAFVSFLVDEVTLKADEYPIMAVWLPVSDGELGEPKQGAAFRVVAAELWAVENNLNLFNIDWAEFVRAADEDGVFGGF